MNTKGQMSMHDLARTMSYNYVTSRLMIFSGLKTNDSQLATDK